MMPTATRLLSIAAALALLLGPAEAASRSHKRSPNVEITATATVETQPRRVVHSNRRLFEELDMTIRAFERVPDPGDDTRLPIVTNRPVHLVHDLTCGGTWVDLKPGDTIELKGEYVHPPDGRDLVHFTHPANGSCGSGRHASGYLRKRAG